MEGFYVNMCKYMPPVSTNWDFLLVIQLKVKVKQPYFTSITRDSNR